MPNQSVRRKIMGVLEKFDGLSLECDGFTRVASYALNKAKIDHQTMSGFVETPAGRVEPHWWIVAGGWTVDYRLRMWAGKDAPHGLFVPSDGVEYYGDPVPMHCNDLIFDILTKRLGK